MVLTDLDPAVPGGGAPRVDAHTEDALVRGIQRVAGLAAQPALDDDAQLLTRLLVQVHLRKPSRQRVVLHLVSINSVGLGRRTFKDTNLLMSSLLVIFVWGGETILLVLNLVRNRV
jgi:hypothetical protein